MWLVKIFLFFLVVCYSVTGFAGSDKPLAPFYLSVQEALATNNQIKQAQARLASAMTLYAQARAVVMPQLSLDWRSSYDESSWQGGNSASDPTTMTLSVKQSLFNMAAFREMSRVDPQVKALEQDLEAVRQDVYFALIQVSTALLEARETARLAKNNMAVTERHLEATKARFSVGEVTQTDVSQAASRVATAKANWIRRLGDSLVSEAQFQEIAGISVPDGLQIPIVISDMSKETMVQLRPLVDRRPDLLASQYRLQAEQTRVQVTKAGHYPTLSLNSSGSRIWDPASSSTPGPYDSFSVSLTASLPIYSGGLTTAQTKQAKSDRDIKMADLDLLRERAKRELKEVLAKYASAKATDEALKTAVSAAQEAKDGVNQEYMVGSRTSLDLLDAQNELFSAQTDQTKSQFAVNLALFELLKVVGRLTPDGDGFSLVADATTDSPPAPMAHD